MCETGAGGKALVASVRHRRMRLLLARIVSVAVALGVLSLLVVQATTSGCASQRADVQDPSLTTQVMPSPVATAPVATQPVPTAAESKPPAPPTPVMKGPAYLPATKAAPVFYPSNPPPSQAPQAVPQQQAPGKGAP